MSIDVSQPSHLQIWATQLEFEFQITQHALVSIKDDLLIYEYVFLMRHVGSVRYSNETLTSVHYNLT